MKVFDNTEDRIYFEQVGTRVLFCTQTLFNIKYYFISEKVKILYKYLYCIVFYIAFQYLSTGACLLCIISRIKSNFSSMFWTRPCMMACCFLMSSTSCPTVSREAWALVSYPSAWWSDIRIFGQRTSLTDLLYLSVNNQLLCSFHRILM